jgi:hypothetical protein
MAKMYKITNTIEFAFTYMLIFFLFLTSCTDEKSSSPLKFKGYEGNPVLVPGEPGSWDDLYVVCCYVLEYDDTIFLYYVGAHSKGGGSLGLATSADGYHFKKYPGNPILTRDKKGYDAFSVGPAGLLKEDSLWVLYFNAREIAGYGGGVHPLEGLLLNCSGVPGRKVKNRY